MLSNPLERVFEVHGPRAEYRGVSNSIAFGKDGSQLFADGGNATAIARDANDGK